jgi:hypothetical protein
MYNKPSGLVKLMNTFVGFLSSLGLIPGGTAQLQVKGRRSGQIRKNAVTWVDYEGQRYLVAPRGTTEWVRNARADGGKAVLKHGKSETVRLEELPVEQRAAIIRPYLKKTGRVTKREFGIDPEAPTEEFERIAPDHPVFRVVPADGE